MKKIILILAMVLATNMFAVSLKWELDEGDRLEVLRTADVTNVINKSAIGKVFERNIIDLTCYKKEGQLHYVKGAFTLYSKEEQKDTFKYQGKHYSDFSINSNGSYRVPPNIIMPNERNIPTFPQRDLKAGDKWTAPAMIIVDTFKKPIVLNFNVNYQLFKVFEKNGKKMALVAYQYSLKKKNARKNKMSEVPDAIVLTNEGVVLWDIANKTPVMSEDNYYETWLYLNNKNQIATREWQMKLKTFYKIYPIVNEKEKETARKELERDLKTEEGLTVDKNKEGLVIRMGEVLFDFDSYAIKPKTKESLEKIVKIIKKKYPDREIIIEGHTDSKGAGRYNQTLSENRAKSVAEFLNRNLGHDKLSYKGYGMDKPLNDNSTAEKRKKNRRVDIIIKLN